MIEKILLYAAVFSCSLVLTLVLTPLVRGMNRRFGMIDRPDPRRINTVPIPRGGGLALVLGTTVTLCAFIAFGGRGAEAFPPQTRFLRLAALAAALAALGYTDDKFGMNPKVKLLGQLTVAFFTWFWADLGFNDLWPSIPVWLDCAVTVFWIAGAINAFNLIDGLDGLASGLALIATVGMGGALAFSGSSAGLGVHLAFAGALLGFLRYNYHPASVFLGDCGSMFIGYVLSVLPLCSHAPNSFLISIGVPLLAMGVPIFDTSLAIFRRSVRRLLNRGAAAKDGQVMQADVDHLHHRILREVGLNQRKAAWTLYALAALLVAIGFVGLVLKSRAAGLWIVGVVVVTVILFRDASRIELFDTGRLLDTLAHGGSPTVRSRWARLSVPFLVMADLAVLAGVFYCVTQTLGKPFFVRQVLRVALPVRVLPIFLFLTALGAYNTVWARAMLSNYVRLFAACVLGSLAGTVILYYYLADVPIEELATETILCAVLPFLLLVAVRLFRGILRDTFYHITVQRLKDRKDVSRLLVYGTGLRYRTFRRELVRQAASTSRVIVGLIDDDPLLTGHRIGGQRVLGALEQAPEAILALNADTVVIAFKADEERRKAIRDALAPTGVKVTYFNFEETSVA